MKQKPREIDVGGEFNVKVDSEDFCEPSSVEEDDRIYVYNNKLQSLFREGLIYQMFSLCEEIREKKVKFNIHTYNWLLCAFEASKVPSRCIRALKEMEDSHIVPTSVSYSIVFKALVYTSDIIRAKEIYDQMIDKGIRPSIIGINSLLEISSNAADSLFAMKLMNDVVHFGLQPNLQTYSQLLKCFCLTEPHKLLKWLRIVDRDVKNFTGSLPTSTRDQVFTRFILQNYSPGLEYIYRYNKANNVPMETGYLLRMLEALARSEIVSIPFAESLHKELTGRMGGISPAIFSTMLTIYMKSDLRKTFIYMSEGIASGLELHPFVSQLLSTCIGYTEEQVDKTYFLLETLRNENIQISVECLNIIISNCSYIGDFDRAYGTYLEIPGFGLKPNASTIVALLNYEGQLDKKYVVTIFEEIEKHGIQISSKLMKKVDQFISEK